MKRDCVLYVFLFVQIKEMNPQIKWVKLSNCNIHKMYFVNSNIPVHALRVTHLFLVNNLF